MEQGFTSAVLCPSNTGLCFLKDYWHLRHPDTNYSMYMISLKLPTSIFLWLIFLDNIINDIYWWPFIYILHEVYLE